MSTIPTALAAVIVSTIPIVLLCLGDPKRRRASGNRGAVMPSARRRGLATIACLPGVACAALGNPAALMLWLGGCALFGWASATWLRASTGR